MHNDVKNINGLYKYFYECKEIFYVFDISVK